MDDCELITLITAISCSISKCYSNDELSLISAAFSQLGDTLATVLAQREIRENNANNKTSNKEKKDNNAEE